MPMFDVHYEVAITGVIRVQADDRDAAYDVAHGQDLLLSGETNGESTYILSVESYAND